MSHGQPVYLVLLNQGNVVLSPRFDTTYQSYSPIGPIPHL